MAAIPSPTAVGFICQPRSHSAGYLGKHRDYRSNAAASRRSTYASSQL
jgi:hypothetical protein